MADRDFDFDLRKKSEAASVGLAEEIGEGRLIRQIEHRAEPRVHPDTLESALRSLRTKLSLDHRGQSTVDDRIRFYDYDDY